MNIIEILQNIAQNTTAHEFIGWSIVIVAFGGMLTMFIYEIFKEKIIKGNKNNIKRIFKDMFFEE